MADPEIPEPETSYTQLDTDILTTLNNSTRSALKLCKAYYLGQSKINGDHFTIDIAQSGDSNEDERFDGDDRLLSYVLIIHLKKLEYLKARRIMGMIIRDIKNELKLNPLFTWRESMRIGDITPIYDDMGILKKSEIQLLFRCDEDYEDEEETFTDVNAHGELIDD